ncbi:amino acid ABC transporter permease [Desertifilum tharense IPPAS B-1220]|uniref:Amino acid ABC transporter permease n=2 Tax=Desertifilum TaxID=1185872 RepID=A0A1E5QKY1_9CYAN|nr:amino acid ABC transporter permease [Desertifilum tharense]OEJ75254.1 amino acid ABC transporter permease [Desertifilum tharense IPPAS B-1220]
MTNSELHVMPLATQPPVQQLGPKAWLRKNLFSTWYNSLITIVLGGILFRSAWGFFQWATTTAQWRVISVNFPLFFVGRYPKTEYWRLWLVVILLGGLSGLSWGIIGRKTATLFSRSVLLGLGIAALLILLTPIGISYKLLLLGLLGLVVAKAWAGKQLGNKIPSLGQWVASAWLILFPVILWLIAGGFGLRSVSTNDWGGLLLTLLTSVISILLCFPLGVLLALGRQSPLLAIRWLSILYIELIRGIPLISILFMGQVMFPLFLPAGMRPDRILRAIVGLTLFSAAYLAENVRGGLQAIPRGQTEAAKALGLNSPLMLGLIILPQALKVAIPAMVGQFISLLQDTTLLSIVGLVELLGMSRSILANPQFLGRYAEVYLFDAVLFWIFCYAMSLASRRLEKQLNSEHR